MGLYLLFLHFYRKRQLAHNYLSILLFWSKRSINPSFPTHNLLYALETRKIEPILFPHTFIIFLRWTNTSTCYFVWSSEQTHPLIRDYIVSLLADYYHSLILNIFCSQPQYVCVKVPCHEIILRIITPT